MMTSICGARRPSFSLSCLAAASIATASSADIVASGIVNINIPSTESGVRINLVTGETGTSSSLAGWDFRFATSYALLCEANFATPLAGFARGYQGAGGVNNLPLGTIVGPGTFLFTPSSTPTFGEPAANWVLSSGDNYAGVRFRDEDTGQYHYGWIRFCVGVSFAEQPRSIVEYAYESTPGASIAIGAGGTGQPADCGFAPSCISLPACGENLPSSSTIDCVTFETSSTCGSLILLGDVNWKNPGLLPWKNTAWEAPPGPQVPATILGLGKTPPHVITVKTLTLRNVDMDSDGNRFRLDGDGDTSSLILENGRLDCEYQLPIILATAPFDLKATSGMNTLYSLDGYLSAPTSLKVSPGASLKFDYCGSLAAGLPNQFRCYFDDDTNHGDVDGGTLELHYSHVIFNDEAGELAVRNGGSLTLSGAGSRLRTDRLRISGSTMQLGLGGVGVEASALTLGNADVNLAESATITATFASVTGSTTVRIDGGPGTTTGLFGSVEINGENSELILAGDGAATLQSLYLQGSSSPNPRVRLTESADLRLVGFINDWTDGTLEIAGATSSLEVAAGSALFSVIPIECQGGIFVGGSMYARGVIGGTGLLRVDGGGDLGITDVAEVDAGTLTVGGPVAFLPESRLSIQVYPTLNQSQRLIAQTSVAVSAFAHLNIYVDPDTDASLPVGTRFGVIDYPGVDDFTGHFWKSDDTGPLLPGDLITSGQNTYRIAYHDPEFDPGNPTMVTLTVVDPDPCLGDLNRDGTVDAEDLAILLAEWGPCGKGGCTADLNGSGAVDGEDLAILLAQWGTCP